MPERYASYPISMILAALPCTSVSIFFMYSAILSMNSGLCDPRMRMARSAALVELLMPTVATGTPR